MNILIIGNGFDIAHNLPTKYKDFLKVCRMIKRGRITIIGGTIYVENLKPEETEKIQELYSCMGQDLWDEFEKIVVNNFWIKHFRVRQQIIGEDWIDFENEIKILVSKLYEESQKTTNEIFDIRVIEEADVHQFCREKALHVKNHTWREVFDALFSEYGEMVRAIEIYMDGFINQIEVNKIPYIEKIRADKVLSFNYTCTYTENYGWGVECCYIHGKANSVKNKEFVPVVLGFDDHYIDKAEVIPELVPYEKYYQRIVNRMENQYLDWLDIMKETSDHTVFIYGHSLGLSDGDVLREFILCKNVKTVVYYYSNADRATKILHLAQIVGPDSLIRLTGGKEPRLVFETD